MWFGLLRSIMTSGCFSLDSRTVDYPYYPQWGEKHASTGEALLYSLCSFSYLYGTVGKQIQAQIRQNAVVFCD